MKKYNDISQNEVDKEIKKLATRLKELRKEKGYKSHENFAFDHGIPRAQYGRYEKDSDIRYSSLVKLVMSHGMTLEEFFKDM
jgi:hypothetical protein